MFMKCELYVDAVVIMKVQADYLSGFPSLDCPSFCPSWLVLPREHVLGRANPDTIHYVRCRGAVEADGGRFYSAMNLWQHCLRLEIDSAKKGSNAEVWSILRFALISAGYLRWKHWSGFSQFFYWASF